MNKIICSVLYAALLMSLPASAQVMDGAPMDSTIIRFTNGVIPDFIPDTSSGPLWQIGHSHKVFFGIDTTATTIMTDTINHYRKNADNWFIIKISGNRLNPIIDFWHKFQTDTGHAGGVVEFSLDKGNTWENVKGDCNVDSNFLGHGVLTTNFYTFNDTLRTGEPSFTGINDTLQYSRIQLFSGFPDRRTSGSDCVFHDTIFVRFRFISDTMIDSLAGWEIDSIKIENDGYGSGGVAMIGKQQSLNIYPNPSFDGSFSFPVLDNEERYNIQVYNTMGERILEIPYKESINLNQYSKGLYFYKVSDGAEYYSGQLQTE